MPRTLRATARVRRPRVCADHGAIARRFLEVARLHANHCSFLHAKHPVVLYPAHLVTDQFFLFVVPDMLLDVGIRVVDVGNFFSFLDLKGSEQLDVDEFLTGVLRASEAPMRREVTLSQFRLQKEIGTFSRTFAELGESIGQKWESDYKRLAGIEEKVNALTEQLASEGEDIG